MTFKFLSYIKGQQITTSTTSAATAFAVDGTQPTVNNAIRVQNIDPTNGVYVRTGINTVDADDHCHFVPALGFLDLTKRDSDTHIACKAAAGTPKVNVHFGHPGHAD
jgi:hypothetical protein